jgi:hypothetical protein
MIKWMLLVLYLLQFKVDYSSSASIARLSKFGRLQSFSCICGGKIKVAKKRKRIVVFRLVMGSMVGKTPSGRFLDEKA